MKYLLQSNKLPKEFKGLLSFLLWLILATILLHVFWQIVLWSLHTDNRVLNDVVNRFGLDEELSFPTWVNSMLALIAGCFAWVVGKHKVNKRKKTTWYVVALVGVLISIDEVASFHELLLQALHILAKFGDRQDFLDNAWLILLPLILIGVIYGVYELHKNLPRHTSKRLVIALFVYLLGALVVEFLSIPFDKSLLVYNLGMVVLEETLEMIGVWLALRAVLLHINEHEPELEKKLTDII